MTVAISPSLLGVPRLSLPRLTGLSIHTNGSKVWPNDFIGGVPALRDQNIDLPQPRDDLFRQSSPLDTAELEEIKQ